VLLKLFVSGQRHKEFDMNTSFIYSPEIADRLTTIIADIKKIESKDLSFAPGDDFLSILNIDSLDSVQLTMRITSEFGFNFGEEIDDIDALGSFGGLATLVHARMQDTAS
jgi:acyl carrier protein